MITHQIVRVSDVEQAGSVLWRCVCGDEADGYDSVAEARLAAAEHQLPVPVQRQLADWLPDVDTWQIAVRQEAEDAARAAPRAWRWWHTTAEGTPVT